MKLNFIKAQDIDRNAKATIHQSGKLGFSSDAANKLGLAGGVKGIIIAMNEDRADENLYIKVMEGISEAAFTLIKAGDYYYVNAKAFFDTYDIDYRNNKIVYDILNFTYEGEAMFKFLKRELKKKQISEGN